ncbi:phage tail terminator protein [Pseudomonas gorinensis]
MKISLIVAQLRAYCPAFSNRVSAGIDWDAVASSAKLSHPSAYVIAAGDEASANDVDNAIRQDITDLFDVILVLDSTDERGQEAADLLHDLRASLWKAVVGWKPSVEYDPITYGGGSLIFINRARVVYRFSFEAAFQLGRNRASEPAETWEEWKLDGLPAFEGMDVDVDFIDPSDPSLKTPGPDGRIDAQFSVDLPQP